MARKKVESEAETATATAGAPTEQPEEALTTVPQSAATTHHPPPAEGGSNGNGGAKAAPPVFKCGPIATDKDNSVEAAVWARQIRTKDDRAFTVYSVSVQASWRDTGGPWKRGHSFRGSQIYALLYCLQRCSDGILARRAPATPL